MIFTRKLRMGRAKALAHLNRVAERGVKHQRPPMWLGAEYMIYRPFRFGDNAQFTFDVGTHDTVREASRCIVDQAA